MKPTQELLSWHLPANHDRTFTTSLCTLPSLPRSHGSIHTSNRCNCVSIGNGCRRDLIWLIRMKTRCTAFDSTSIERRRTLGDWSIESRACWWSKLNSSVGCDWLMECRDRCCSPPTQSTKSPCAAGYSHIRRMWVKMTEAFQVIDTTVTVQLASNNDGTVKYREGRDGPGESRTEEARPPSTITVHYQCPRPPE